MTFATSGKIGVNLDEATSDRRHIVGTVVELDDGGYATYVSAASTISTYAAVVIDDKGGAVPVTTTNSANSKRVAFAQVSIASGYFGWVKAGGKVIVNLAANCDDNVPLYTTATAGVLDDAVVSGGLCIGITSTTTISNATAVTCVCSRGVTIGTGDMD